VEERGSAGDRVTTREKYGVSFAVVGFAIGEILYGYTFYSTSHGGAGDMFLFMVLCPASFSSMALDNAGVTGGLIAWLFISIVNAVMYGLMGLGVASKLRKK
jgi:hypothetical protein